MKLLALLPAIALITAVVPLLRYLKELYKALTVLYKEQPTNYYSEKIKMTEREVNLNLYYLSAVLCAMVVCVLYAFNL